METPESEHIAVRVDKTLVQKYKKCFSYLKTKGLAPATANKSWLPAFKGLKGFKRVAGIAALEIPARNLHIKNINQRVLDQFQALNRSGALQDFHGRVGNGCGTGCVGRDCGNICGGGLCGGNCGPEPPEPIDVGIDMLTAVDQFGHILDRTDFVPVDYLEIQTTLESAFRAASEIFPQYDAFQMHP